jgi:hypothetical protein
MSVDWKMGNLIEIEANPLKFGEVSKASLHNLKKIQQNLRNEFQFPIIPSKSTANPQAASPITPFDHPSIELTNSNKTTSTNTNPRKIHFANFTRFQWISWRFLRLFTDDTGPT